MICRLYKVVTTADPVPAARRMRVWLGMGETMAVAGVVFRPMHWWAGFDPVLEIGLPNRPWAPAPLAPLTLNELGPYRVIPRAIRAAGGRMASVLLEIQHFGSGRPCWAQPTMEVGDHDNFQSLSDPG